jgi:hypothetical protein
VAWATASTKEVVVSVRADAGESRRMVSLGFDDEPWPAGTHMCMIYDDDDERRRVIAKFLQSGLDSHEIVSYFVDNQSPADFLRSLSEAGVVLPETGTPQLRVVPAQDAYCPDGTFDVDRLMGGRPAKYQRVIRDGYAGARVTAEMSWVHRGLPGSDNLLEYEARLNTHEGRAVPSTGLCQYDARVFDGAVLHEILSVHPTMVVHGQVLRNPYFVEPEVFLAKRAARSED